MSTSRALVQGSLLGALVKAQMGETWLRVTNIDQPTNEAGDYLDYFVVTLFSGAKVRVSVTDEEA